MKNLMRTKKQIEKMTDEIRKERKIVRQYDMLTGANNWRIMDSQIRWLKWCLNQSETATITAEFNRYDEPAMDDEGKGHDTALAWVLKQKDDLISEEEEEL